MVGRVRRTCQAGICPAGTVGHDKRPRLGIILDPPTGSGWRRYVPSGRSLFGLTSRGSLSTVCVLVVRVWVCTFRSMKSTFGTSSVHHWPLSIFHFRHSDSALQREDLLQEYIGTGEASPVCWETRPFVVLSEILDDKTVSEHTLVDRMDSKGWCHPSSKNCQVFRSEDSKVHRFCTSYHFALCIVCGGSSVTEWPQSSLPSPSPCFGKILWNFGITYDRVQALTLSLSKSLNIMFEFGFTSEENFTWHVCCKPFLTVV